MPTLRLTFAYENGSIRLLSRQRVDMVAPASEPTEAEEPQAGFWFELRDAREGTLYQRTMEDPTDPTVEVRTGDPERPFTRAPAHRLRREFVVLVPDIEERQNLVFFGRPAPGITDEPSTEIARFPLR